MHTRIRGRAVAATTVAVLLTAGSATAALAGAADDPTAGDAPAAAHEPPSEQEIREQFDRWDDALATGDPERVADLYTPDAVLVPTQSNEVRTDRAGIVDYFEHFLAQDPSSEITESHVRVLDEDSAVDTGTYRFELTDAESGERVPVDARYTFVYERVAADGGAGAAGGAEEEWRIVHHHSSAMPEG